MRALVIAANDLFFSALGFYLGLWFYERRSSRGAKDDQ